VQCSHRAIVKALAPNYCLYIQAYHGNDIVSYHYHIYPYSPAPLGVTPHAPYAL
jgi:hypothetical protein